MKKALLLTLLLALITVAGFSQTDRFWSANMDSRSSITTDKAVARLAYPKEFKLFNLNTEPLRQKLFTIVGVANQGRSTTISLPNADGGIEEFEVWEASNFVPELQARYPEIRAYSGRGITDRYALLKLSISPRGIQTMVFRADKPSEFIEPYSNDHNVYSVYKSQRDKTKLQWVCSTVDTQLATSINAKVAGINGPQSNTGEIRTMRLAQSVNGEYSNWFGATSAAQSALVYAAINATLTRCNGCYEKDLAIHLNLISNTFEDQIIFYNPATDPYTTMGAWNGQLQNLLNTVVGDANYDIGHMFGASGGGGNAGCIGCVCVAGTKGSGITSPADGIPQGDNFDIDYVVHEVGHQMGGNHSFTFSNEGTVAQKEVGAGITIMGYAGITSYDPAPHSIDIYHEANIAQIQANMATKSCPVLTTMTVNHPPVVAALTNYTIPISTPFYLTGSATDPESDPITYCWEQNDVHGGQTASNSVAYATKPTGPNWLSFSPSTNPTRLLPKLSTILAGLLITPTLPGGDAICNIEALSSISRTLNFRLTVRDNRPYVPGSTIGQTQFQDMAVTVTNTSGPFQVTIPNTNVSWAGGSTQTITWNVNNTTAAPVSCANVMISLSTDGGQTFPTVLAASTPNDGTEALTIPTTASTTARIKIEAVGNIFFDISNTNFTITAPVSGFTLGASAPSAVTCPAPASMQTTLTATFAAGFTNPITLSASGNPAGTSVVFGTNPLTTGAPSSTVTLTGTNTLTAGAYTITVTGVAAGAPNQTQNITFTINAGSGPAVTAQPVPQTICVGANTTFGITAATATSFQWQVSTDGGASWNNVTNTGVYTNATTATLSLTGVTLSMNGYLYRCIAGVQCGSTNSSNAQLTVQASPAITSQPAAATVCGGTNSTSFSVTATGATLTYQWQVSATGCGGAFSNVVNGGVYTNANTASLTITNAPTTMNGYAYQCIVSGTCAPAVTSACGLLTANTPISITTQPANATICAGSNTSFAVVAAGTSPTYQWQVSTDGGTTWGNISNGGVYSTATTATLNITAATAGMTGYRYRCVVTGTAACGALNTNGTAALTVQTSPVVSASPTDITLCVGSSNTFNVTANGTGLIYQWQVSTDGGTTYTNLANGAPYSGVSTAALTVNPLTAAMNTYRFRCAVSGTCAPAVNSAVGILTVISPVTITTQPTVSTAICSTGNTSFTVAGSSTVTILYQWQVSTDAGATWNNVTAAAPYSGTTTATLTITNVPTSLSGYRYRCLLSNATCTVPTISNSSALTVNVLPTASIAAPKTALQAGDFTIITATTTPASGLTIAWFRDGILIPGATSNSYTVNVNNLGKYKVVVTDIATGTCINQSNELTITALPSDKLFIFPSPNNGQFTVTYYNAGSTTTQGITIYDDLGRRVFNSTFPVNQAYQLHKIDMRRNGAGVYHVVLRDANGKKLKSGEVLVR